MSVEFTSKCSHIILTAREVWTTLQKDRKFVILMQTPQLMSISEVPAEPNLQAVDRLHRAYLLCMISLTYG